jgi:DNA (cytosine-5)-methyltransferase 1
MPELLNRDVALVGLKSNDADYVRLINRPVTGTSERSLPSVSLFSGILGIELGLERAGFECRLALDQDEHAKEVVEANRAHLKDFPYLAADVNVVSPEDVLRESNLAVGETALLAGGPPCQPFSKSGLRLGTLDERGSLFKRYLEYLNTMKPRSFLLENVRGLFSSRGGQDFRDILSHFDDTGYTVYWKILDCANFGVPQYRQRLFIVGFRDPLRFTWPSPTHEDPDTGHMFALGMPFRTAADAIGDGIGIKGPPLTGRYSHLLPEIPEGLNYSFYTAERGHPNPLFEWRSKFWYFLLKLARNKPALTIQAYPGNNTGPFHWENRRLSVDELKRLQSFPDWFAIDKSYMAAHRLIGNAVPPLMAEALGRSVRAALEDDKKIDRLEYLSLRAMSQQQSGTVRSGRGSGKGKFIVAPGDVGV